MDLKKIAPPIHLKNYVRYFWTLDNNARQSAKTFRIFADGCPGLIFNQSEKCIIYQNNEKRLPDIFLYGQATTHNELNLTGHLSLIGAYFYPNALKAIFGLDADELTDSCADLNPLAEKQGVCLAEKLSGATSTPHQIEMISRYLFQQLQKNAASQSAVIQYAISQIVESAGKIALGDLRKDLGLSERSLERKFRQEVGISPKLFSRIRRFQVSLEQIRKNRYRNLSDIAYDNDYADQSHFIRAFREFSGFSPYQFQKSSNEIIENMSEL
ncbi:MAG: helix-turn-helix domain-containing protein [Acidobacteriota bacterium]